MYFFVEIYTYLISCIKSGTDFFKGNLLIVFLQWHIINFREKICVTKNTENSRGQFFVSLSSQWIK